MVLVNRWRTEDRWPTPDTNTVGVAVMSHRTNHWACERIVDVRGTHGLDSSQRSRSAASLLGGFVRSQRYGRSVALFSRLLFSRLSRSNHTHPPIPRLDLTTHPPRQKMAPPAEPPSICHLTTASRRHSDCDFSSNTLDEARHPQHQSIPKPEPLHNARKRRKPTSASTPTSRPTNAPTALLLTPYNRLYSRLRVPSVIPSS